MGFIKRLAGNIVPNQTSISNALGSVVREASQTALSAAFPDQYESYHLVLQLLWANNTIESFTFPVMPESLLMAQQYLMTVTPTLNGNFVDDFGWAPSPINLQGTFGKKLRTIVGAGLLNNPGQALRSTTAATGYGMAKQLSELVEKSHTPDDGGLLPKTVLFNWAFSSHWEVAINGFNVAMSDRQNGLWFYNLQLTALRTFGDNGNATDLLVSQVLGSVINNTVGKTVAAGVQIVNAVNAAKGWINSARKANG